MSIVKKAMIVLWWIIIGIVLLLAGALILATRSSGDDLPSRYTSTSELDDLKARVAALEAAVFEHQNVAAVGSKPKMYVHTSDNCVPCATFKREVAAAKDFPFEVVYTKWEGSGSRVPSFKWTSNDGSTKTRVGYRSGTLDSFK